MTDKRAKAIGWGMANLRGVALELFWGAVRDENWSGAATVLLDANAPVWAADALWGGS